MGYVEVKRCTKCKEEYPIEHFSKKGSGRSTRCSKCVAEYFRNYYHKNPERKAKHQERVKKNKIKNRHRDLAKKYNTTEDHIKELLAANGGLCAICKFRPSVHIDHCHETGIVRGALCSPCNLGLGQFQDNPEWLISAAAYLRAVYPHPDKVLKG